MSRLVIHWIFPKILNWLKVIHAFNVLRLVIGISFLDAQKSLATTDVLICGGCHEVYYLIEEFQSHKDSKTCAGKSVLKCENEEKAQIWGFTLWKTKQAHIHKEKGETVPTSWEIYQKWTKLQPNEKELWVTAGHNLQVIGKISSTKYKEIKEKERDPLSFDDGKLF